FTLRLQRLLVRLRLPTKPERWPVDDLLTVMRLDKKAVAGRMRFVLPRQLGEVALFDDIPESDGRAWLPWTCPQNGGPRVSEVLISLAGASGSNLVTGAGRGSHVFVGGVSGADPVPPSFRSPETRPARLR